MPSYTPTLDNDRLLRWADVLPHLEGPRALLLGNGASRAIWNGFSYRSLYEAATDSVDHALDEDDRALFDEFGGTDFELVLGALLVARRVCDALSISTLHIRDRYRSIQRALREAVVSVHVPWTLLSQNTLSSLRVEYRSYGAIYTTNYDLIPYWAVMSTPTDPTEFVDFFWGPGLTFDPWDTGVRSSHATTLLYLHGALHLRHAVGRTRKVAAAEVNLLDAMSSPFTGQETPLIVTEGTSAEKERAIRTSDYLLFALSQLVEEQRPLVVFGQALGAQDDHIARALGATVDRPIAVAIHGDGNIAARKRHFADRLEGADLFFFDSSTHPLGDPTLAV